MSDYGTPATVTAPAPEPERPGSDIPMWLIIVVVLALLVGGGVLAVAVLTQKDDDQGPAYPAAWDARVLPYVKIVEKERGLSFLHPVTVRFQSSAAFEKGVRSDEKDLDADDRKEIRQFTGLMRAFGLITGDVDLFAAFNDATGSGTLAYYAFKDKRITIRGQALTPASKKTLVHELTHALQDQHFDIGARKKRLNKDADDGAETNELTVFDAIVEGDAERIATRYAESLTAAQRKVLARSEKKERSSAEKGMKGVPKVVLTLISAPYSLGEALVQTVDEDGGNKAVDSLFRDTPTHESALLDPFSVLADDLGAEKVAAPVVKDGEKRFESGEFGVLTWYLMLAERLPVAEALAVVDGWGGDAYVGYEADGESCARIRYVGDTRADTTRMLGALRQWIAKAPGSPATVSGAGGTVLFESCDPGKKATVGNDASIDALTLATVRGYLGLSILKAGVPAGPAGCIAGKVATEYPLARLTDPRFGAGDPAVQNRIRQFALACR